MFLVKCLLNCIVITIDSYCHNKYKLHKLIKYGKILLQKLLSLRGS